MKVIRWFLGKIILLLDAIFRAKPDFVRSSADQARIDAETGALALYQFEACPFCVKTRRAITRLGVQIEFRDALKSPGVADELVRGGGELQVPCLRITESTGSIRWLYESDAIIAYLNQRFGQAAG